MSLGVSIALTNCMCYNTHMSEEWRPIVGFDGYEVSNLGRVRSYRSPNGRAPLLTKARLLKPTTFQDRDYVRYGLYDGKRCKTRRGHILVLETFVGPCPPGMQGCHRDDDQSNNRLDNLYWGTHQENVADKVRNGKQVRGSQVSRAVIDEVTAARIKRKIANDNTRGSLTRIAREEGVSIDVVNGIKRNKTWRHVCP